MINDIILITNSCARHVNGAQKPNANARPIDAVVISRPVLIIDVVIYLLFTNIWYFV